MTRRTRSLTLPVAVLATAALLLLPAVAGARPHHRRAVLVGPGETWVVPHTTHLRRLEIAPGAGVVAPDGYSLTLTVDGVETGSRQTATGGTDTAIAPGTYRGRVVLTVAEANLVPWQALTFPFRQALYVGADGVDWAKSVPAAVSGGRVTDSEARDIRIASTGEAFNGVYVKDAPYTLVRPRISLIGNGRSDFVGYGAALVGTGTNTRLVVDGADIANRGAVRTGVVADGGSNVIVKNSRIHTDNGVLPADYQSTVDLTYMEQAPWMLGIVGNVRATNLLGVDTKASYINSSISSQGWGVLSTDTGSNGKLTAIDSHIATTGGEGYGSYAIGNATERFLGSRFDVDTYATINRGGSVHYGDSTRAAVAQLNGELGLGLSARELAALPVRRTVIDSQRWGVMWHGAGSVDVSGGTIVNSDRATFLDKGQQVAIDVDGSQGARLNPRNGILLQLMEDDDPGPQMVDGKLLNTGVYHEPTGDPAKVPAFDVTAVNADDAVATFKDIALRGDFYNGIRGANPAGPFGPGMQGKNMVLNFDDARIAGVISASQTRHAVDTITAADYLQLGQVTNTVHPVVNNGVIVNLAGRSRWTVTGTSYLSRLTVGADAAVRAAGGGRVSMTVDGVATPIVPGTTYSGAIVVTVG
jgi:hypothetical protein